MQSSSQLTLVDPSALLNDSSNSFVSFLRDDMTNTEIHSADGRRLFVVQTDQLTNSKTTLRRYTKDGEIVAAWDKKSILPSTIKFGQQSSMKLSAWLHGQTGSWKDFPVGFDWEGQSYTWKADGRRIALFRGQDAAEPIAWFHSSRTEIVNGNPTKYRAAIIARKEALEILDGVVISLLVLEQELKVQDKIFHAYDGSFTYYVRDTHTL